MSEVGSKSSPLRVAIVGAGAAGFYTIAQLLKGAGDKKLEIDLLEKLPTPYGLVRSGVAPDHQKDKSVARVFDMNGAHPAVRYFGGISMGEDFSLAELRRHYHQIVITTGAGNSRALGIAGEDLPGVYAATDFVGWYNAHPKFQDQSFDLHSDTAAIIGVGNVSVDIARVLAKTTAELAPTDIAAHALAALGQSKVRNIYLIGRRGPAQASFTPDEIRDLGAVDGVHMVVTDADAAVDELSKSWLEEHGDKNAKNNVRLIQEFAEQHDDAAAAAARVRVHLKFWCSPLELHGDGGRLASVLLARGAPELSGERVVARPTDEALSIPAGLLFRSVGYQAAPLADVPFDERRSVIPNDKGRILNGDSPLSGIYTAGWVKRGPTGVIGTNKTCARETVACMLEDVAAGKLPTPEQPSRAAAEALFTAKGGGCIDYAGWQLLDAEEVRRGETNGKIREKFLNISEMMTVARGG